MNLPPVVSQTEWQEARDALLAEEKQATRDRDALAARRRRLPMVRMDKDYVFDGPDGKAALPDLFEGRSQLLLYHFMFGPNQDAGCDGCSMFVDQVGHLAHLHARDTSFAIVSRAPIAKIEPYRKRMGWTIPWFSSFDSDFNVDFGVSPETPQPDVYQDGESFGLSVFLRDGESVFRTYFTTTRGVEALGSVWTFLDLTPLGRQEEWENSPEGYPQEKPYEWWRRHDEYENSALSRRSITPPEAERLCSVEAAAAALGRREQRDPDRGQGNRDKEPDKPVGVEEVGEDAAEEAGRDADERRRKQANLVFAREHEPPEATDDQARDRKPEKLEREADERPGQQQSQDDDKQDGDDGHGADATERRRRTCGGRVARRTPLY